MQVNQNKPAKDLQQGGGAMEDAPAKSIFCRLATGLRTALRLMTVEPVVFIDGACYWSMTVFMEVVQMEKICASNLGFSHEVCSNLSAHTEESLQVQKQFSIFAFYNSIFFSVFPLIFVLFMGAWSDKYGRKIPLLITLGCHVLWSGGYLLNTWQTAWPVEIIYFVTFLGSVGGGPQGLLSSAIAYISDVTSVKSRTGRVSNTVSSWYLGGPLGMLVGAVAIQNVGVELALALVFTAYVSIFTYVFFFIKESHGPFAQVKGVEESPIKKEDVTRLRMLSDLFNWRRVLESFKTALRKREGSARVILIALIISNMVRRAARGFYMYSFVGRALHWDATDFSYWSSYRSLVSAVGSLILVPLLTRLISVSDPMLIVIGSLSIIGEYCCYGLIGGIATGFYIWLGPPAGLISNASIIAQKSMATKLVSSSEKGRVSAVMAATQSLMPMVGYAMYAPIYHQTVENFPAAQFFFGAGLATLIMITFLAIQLANVTYESELTDVEKKMPKDGPAEDNTIQMKEKPASGTAEKKEPTIDDKKLTNTSLADQPVLNKTSAGITYISRNFCHQNGLTGSLGRQSLKEGERRQERGVRVNGYPMWQAYENSAMDEEIQRLESVPVSSRDRATSDREKTI
ncbi:proton-coupled folate transporter-like isoform X2 [Penaeus monodon]|uniref:proton-coupled folate transporter-like isoform X2 n=1 Tax=Penaeus monodon TaxID=6687 RepID=UPI0018A74D84|nr:proton-coupled folate transporter-like isoform X2 [Penaeus monodon]